MTNIAILSLLSAALISASSLSHGAAQTLSQAAAAPKDCSTHINASYSATFDWSSAAALSLAKCLIHTQPRKDSCIFYTSNSKSLALKYASESSRTTIYDVYSPAHFDVNVDPMKRWEGSGHQRDVFKITSKAYALACSGEASVVMPEDEDACPHSIWITDEYEVIRSGESAIKLPVCRVSWVQDKTKKSWGWSVRVLSRVGKRDLRLKQVSLGGKVEGQVPAKVEELSKQWGVEMMDDGKEDLWAVRHGVCGSRFGGNMRDRYTRDSTQGGC